MFKIPIFKQKDIKINYFEKDKGEIILMIPGTGTSYEKWVMGINYVK